MYVTLKYFLFCVCYLKVFFVVCKYLKVFCVYYWWIFCVLCTLLKNILCLLLKSILFFVYITKKYYVFVLFLVGNEIYEHTYEVFCVVAITARGNKQAYSDLFST